MHVHVWEEKHFLRRVCDFFEVCVCVRTYPGVGEGGIVVLCVKLQRDEGDVSGDPGDHRLHRPILRDTHILEGSKGKHHAI